VSDPIYTSPNGIKTSFCVLTVRMIITKLLNTLLVMK